MPLADQNYLDRPVPSRLLVVALLVVGTFLVSRDPFPQDTRCPLRCFCNPSYSTPFSMVACTSLNNRCPVGCLAQYPLLCALMAARRLPLLSSIPLVPSALLDAQHPLSVPYHSFGVILDARRPSDSACSWLICATLDTRRPSGANRRSPIHSTISCMFYPTRYCCCCFSLRPSRGRSQGGSVGRGSRRQRPPPRRCLGRW